MSRSPQPESPQSPKEHGTEAPPAARRADAFLQLRQWLGIIGIALPFVLVLGNVFLRAVLKSPPAWRGWDLQRTMSSYYYTSMQNVFVGALRAKKNQAPQHVGKQISIGKIYTVRVPKGKVLVELLPQAGKYCLKYPITRLIERVKEALFGLTAVPRLSIILVFF